MACGNAQIANASMSYWQTALHVYLMIGNLMECFHSREDV